MRRGQGRAGGRAPGVGRRPASPGPWPPDKGVLEVAEAHFIFPRRGLAKGRKLAEHTCVSLAGRGVCLRGSRRGPRLLPGKLVPSGEAGRDPRPRSGRMPEAGIPLTVEVPARGWGSCRWPGSAPSPLGSLRAGVVPPGSAGAPPAGHSGAWISPKTLHWTSSEFGTFKFSNSYVSGASALQGSGAPRDQPLIFFFFFSFFSFSLASLAPAASGPCRPHGLRALSAASCCMVFLRRLLSSSVLVLS